MTNSVSDGYCSITLAINGFPDIEIRGFGRVSVDTLALVPKPAHGMKTFKLDYLEAILEINFRIIQVSYYLL